LTPIDIGSQQEMDCMNRDKLHAVDDAVNLYFFDGGAKVVISAPNEMYYEKL